MTVDPKVFLSGDDFEDALTLPPASIADAVRVSRKALANVERQVRAAVAAEIEAFADDDSDVSDAYRHAALIATQGATE